MLGLSVERMESCNDYRVGDHVMVTNGISEDVPIYVITKVRTFNGHNSYYLTYVCANGQRYYRWVGGNDIYAKVTLIDSERI